MNTSLFGTDGIRKTVGADPLTLACLPALGSAIAQWALHNYGAQPKILLAHDTRSSCAWVKSALKSGLLLHPIELHDAGVLPTPATYVLTQRMDFTVGIIITASHNLFQDNGIKIIDGRHGKLSQHDEQHIMQLFYNAAATTPSYSAFGSETIFNSSASAYVDSVCSWFTSSLLHGKTIVLDCAHGATYQVAPAIFKQLGAHVMVINDSPTGTNINEHCGAVHPHQLQAAVVHHHADAGFAFDGDGDRLTVVAPDGTIKDGDAIMSLLMQHHAYQNQNTLVGTIMSNQGLEMMLQTHNKKLLRTPVGDKYIAQALQEHNLLLGSEPSGHIIMRDYLNSGDGIFAALRLMEAVAHTGNSSMNSFKPFPHVLINVPVTAKKDLATEPFATIITAFQEQLPLGRLIVRYSGTENLLRIFVEAQDNTVAQDIGASLARALQKELV